MVDEHIAIYIYIYTPEPMPSTDIYIPIHTQPYPSIIFSPRTLYMHARTYTFSYLMSLSLSLSLLSARKLQRASPSKRRSRAREPVPSIPSSRGWSSGLRERAPVMGAQQQRRICGSSPRRPRAHTRVYNGPAACIEPVSFRKGRERAEIIIFAVQRRAGE